MRWFSRRRGGGDRTARRFGPLSNKSDMYTAEIPDVGTGHYLLDHSDPCSIHSKRLEAWCDVDDYDVARDELHWHCLMLSQLGADPGEIRQMSSRLIDSRRQKLTAKKEASIENEVAKVEGVANSAPARADGEREERLQAEGRERDLRSEAEAKEQKLQKLRERFDNLPRRARVPIKFRLVVIVSVSFTIFDVGVFGNALSYISGDWYWKWILVIGVALAPLSTAIGLAQWISAAELPIRQGVKATVFAITAGAACVIGIGLIVLFRKAASGEPPLPWDAYVFLGFLQSALAMAETMLYTVYFDSKVGAALLERIQAAENSIAGIERRAVGEHERAVRAQSRISDIYANAEDAKSRLQRTEPRLKQTRSEYVGEAGVLEGVVEAAILEGVAAATRARERREREELEKQEPADELDLRPWMAGAAGSLMAVSVFAAGLWLGGF
jgi:hypothetical protein